MPRAKSQTKTDADQDFELWALLHQARDALARTREAELRHADLSMIKAAVLFFAKNLEQPVTPAVMSRALFREPHTISGLLDRMETQGLVRRVHDLQRKNMVRIEVTEKGDELYRQSREDRRVIGKVMSVLTQAERDELQSSLKKLRNRALRELRVPYRLPFP